MIFVEFSILLFAFFGGVASFISPCNVAILPTFASYIGSSAKNTRQSFFMSIIFAIGYSVTLAIVGILLLSISGLIQQMKYINLVSGIFLILISFYLLFSKHQFFFGRHRFPLYLYRLRDRIFG